MLIAFKAPPLTQSKEPPKRLQLAKWGSNESTKGKVVVNENTVKLLPQMQRLGGFDTVALDFNHNTVPGEPAYKESKEPREVAANGKPVVIPGEGLFIDDLEWTPQGVKSFSEGHYKDLSPCVKLADDGTVVFMHSAALCRNGSIEGIHAFSAIADPIAMNEILLTLLGFTAGSTPSEKEINEKATAFAKNLAVYSTSAEQITALSTKLDELGKLVAKAAPAAGDNKGAAADPETAKQLTALSTSITELTKKLEGLEKSGDQVQRNALIEKAIRAGKIVPHAAEDLPLKKLEDLLAELPGDQVPLEKRTREGLKTFSASGATSGSDASMKDVQRQLHVSDEDVAKFGK